MFDFFWNWLDPKILKMERWVNLQVVTPDKIDIDLDKIGRDEIRGDIGYTRSPQSRGIKEEHGPFLTNLTGAKLLGYLLGDDQTEVFVLFQKGDNLWWRHRINGATQDYKMPAFTDMQAFFLFVYDEEPKLYWECVLRTQAVLSSYTQEIRPSISLTDIAKVIHSWRGSSEPETQQTKAN